MPAPTPNSVAVLYFENLSRDTADVYLADGLTEELIARLGQIERLAVKSRTAVQRFRGKRLGDPGAVGRTLGVAHLVSGSVRRSAQRLRVTVELVRAATADRVWGDQYDRTAADLLAIQEDIAGAVTRHVAGRLLPTDRATLGERPTRNPVAYDHFLRGNYYLAQRNPRAVARAIEEYGAAARLDPAFTAALARVAYGHALFLDWNWEYPGLSSDTVLARGLAAADRALAQDSATSDAWMARAYLLSFREPRTFKGAVDAFERALAQDPRNAEAHHQYGWILSQLGADSAAIAARHRALAIDPERAITLRDLALHHTMHRRLAEALRWLDSTVVVDPGLYQAYADRAMVRIQLGDATRARADAETALRLSGSPDDPWGSIPLALVEARQGDTASARGRIEPFLRETEHSGYRPTTMDVRLLAPALVALGEHERALQLIEGHQPRGPRLWFFAQAPDLDPIRGRPRFERVMAESRPK